MKSGCGTKAERSARLLNDTGEIETGLKNRNKRRAEKAAAQITKTFSDF